MYGLISLFVISFLAATILPAQSELVLASLMASGKYHPSTLVIVGTVGNVLGSLVNWFLGRYLMQFKDRRWFPVKQEKIDKVSAIYQKWGVATLLFAWVPVIGDPLTLVAGIFKTNVWLFLILVTIGKSLRYIGIISIMN